MSTPRTTACPSCGGALRADAPWCGQCYADFRPPPAAPAVPAVPAPAVPEPAAPAVSPLDAAVPVASLFDSAAPASPAGAADPTWPCTRCQSTNPLDATACRTCGSAFLAAVKDDERPLLELPLVGDLEQLSRGRRLGLAFGVVAAICVPLALITLLTTRGPAPADDDGLPSDPGTVSTTP